MKIRKGKLLSALLLALVLVLVVPSFSSTSEAADDSVFRMSLDKYSLDGSYFQNGQTKTYRISFSISCNNNYTGSARFTLDTRINIPVLPSGFSWSLTDAYYTFGSDRYDVSYEVVGSSSVRLWTSSYVQDLNHHSYVGVYLLLDITYSVPNTVTVTDSRTVTTTTDSYNVYFKGSATGITNMSQLSKLVPMYYIEPSSNSYYVRSHTETFSGNVSSTTDYKDVYFTSPSYKATSKTTSGDLSVSYNYAYLSSVTCTCNVDSFSYLYPESFGVQATNSKLDTANSLLTQIRDKGGVNSDGGTHDRLDSMLTAQASASQKQQEQMSEQYKESQKQTDALTHFDGKAAMDSSNDKLASSIGNYDNAESSIFDTASVSLSKLDFSSSLMPSTGTLGAIVFLGDIISGIIVSMGEFSSLFTVGFVVVLISIIFGLAKYVVSSNTGG